MTNHFEFQLLFITNFQIILNNLKIIVSVIKLYLFFAKRKLFFLAFHFIITFYSLLNIFLFHTQFISAILFYETKICCFRSYVLKLH